MRFLKPAKDDRQRRWWDQIYLAPKEELRRLDGWKGGPLLELVVVVPCAEIVWQIPHQIC